MLHSFVLLCSTCWGCQLRLPKGSYAGFPDVAACNAAGLSMQASHLTCQLGLLPVHPGNGGFNVLPALVLAGLALFLSLSRVCLLFSPNRVAALLRGALETLALLLGP